MKKREARERRVELDEDRGFEEGEKFSLQPPLFSSKQRLHLNHTRLTRDPVSLTVPLSHSLAVSSRETEHRLTSRLALLISHLSPPLLLQNRRSTLHYHQHLLSLLSSQKPAPPTRHLLRSPLLHKPSLIAGPHHFSLLSPSLSLSRRLVNDYACHGGSPQLSDSELSLDERSHRHPSSPRFSPTRPSR
jgi:hypothetical protein